MNEFNPYAPPGSDVTEVAPSGTADRSADVNAPFFAVSMTKFVVLSIFTLGTYELYWFYKNWQKIKARERSDIMPFWRAFFGYFFCYQAFCRVLDFPVANRPNSPLPAGFLAAGWIITSLLYKLPDPYWIVSLGSFLFIVPVHAAALRANEAVAPDHDRNARFSIWNWLTIVLGAVLLVAMFIAVR